MNTTYIQPKINKDDFSYNVTAEGYQILYKGKSIGGAGIMGKSKSRGKGRAADMKMYRESAQREIQYLLQGSGHIYMVENIIKINSGTT